MNNENTNDPNLNRLAAASSSDIKVPKSVSAEIGKSGTVIMQGIITGEEYNRNLVGQSAIRVYDIMRRSDATVHSTLLVCKLPIIGGVWDIEAASDDEADQYVANFVKRELFERNIVFKDHIREALTCLDFGYCATEKVFDITSFDGKVRIGIEKLGFRKQTSILKWQIDGGKDGITQQLQGGQGAGGQVGIPMEKLMIYTNDKEGDNHEGVSVLRYAYKDWDMKDKLGLVNAIALEKLAMGIPILKTPDAPDTVEVARAEQALRQLRANEEAFQRIPNGWSIEMLDMKANSTKDVIPTIKYHDRQIVRSVLAQFLELGGTEGSSGSKALSEDHSALFIKALEAVAETIKTVIQNQLIKQLCDLNFTDLANGYPKLTVSKIGDENVAVLAESVSKLMTAGALTPNYDTENRLRESMQLPELPEDQKELIDERGLAPKVNPLNPNPELPKPNDKLPKDAKTEAALKAARKARKVLVDSLG